MSRLWEAKIPCSWQTFQGVELCAQSGLNAEGSGGTFWDGYGIDMAMTAMTSIVRWISWDAEVVAAL